MASGDILQDVESNQKGQTHNNHERGNWESIVYLIIDSVESALCGGTLGLLSVATYLKKVEIDYTQNTSARGSSG
jgi:hypothetical protein